MEKKIGPRNFSPALREPHTYSLCHVIIPKLSYIRLGGDRLEPIKYMGMRLAVAKTREALDLNLEHIFYRF